MPVAARLDSEAGNEAADEATGHGGKGAEVRGALVPTMCCYEPNSSR